MMLTPRTCSFVVALAACALVSCGRPGTESPAIVPAPMEVEFRNGSMACCDMETAEAKTVASIDTSLRYTLGSEGYALEVNRRGIRMQAASDTGLFYAGVTLRQLLTPQGIRCVRIKDRPRFSYRGIHVDVSRHFFDKQEIMKILDEMAFYKLNNFHFHLTDNGGWRIQIDSYPKLTQLGAYRVMKDWDGWWRLPYRYFCLKDTPGAYGGFYTKNDIREIVEYAAERYINVIPEIEFPAHSDPVFVGYPELNCTGTQYGNGEFCPANEDVYRFAENVLGEIMELFPSQVIHIGADEARKHAWRKCPACAELMRREGMESVDELQSRMVSRLQKFLADNGRSMAGWDEILKNDDLAESSIVYSYRGEKGGIHAANGGVKAVMTPGEILYFDWYQASPSMEPKAMYGYSPIKKMFVFDPQPTTPEAAAANESLVEGREVAPDSVEFIRPEMKDFIIGVQGCAWAEYIPDEKHLEYMMFPRLLAIAEKGWSPEGGSEWRDFILRVARHIPELRARGINVYDLHDVPEVLSDGRSIVMESEDPEAELRFTFDGTDPEYGSALYSEPISVPDTAAVLKVASFRSGVRSGYVREVALEPGKVIREYYPFL